MTTPYGHIIASVAIWAIGRTEEETLADYVRATGDDGPTLDSLSHNPRSGELYIYPCDEALYRCVESHGGDISWDERDGIATVDADWLERHEQRP